MRSARLRCSRRSPKSSSGVAGKCAARHSPLASFASFADDVSGRSPRRSGISPRYDGAAGGPHRPLLARLAGRARIAGARQNASVLPGGRQQPRQLLRQRRGNKTRGQAAQSRGGIHHDHRVAAEKDPSDDTSRRDENAGSAGRNRLPPSSSGGAGAAPKGRGAGSGRYFLGCLPGTHVWNVRMSS
jgi:hypothetical protein